MPHELHIYAKESDMTRATMCAYTQSDNALPHLKCVFRCYEKCTCINIPDQETDNYCSETTPSSNFHIYKIIGRVTAHGIIPSKEKKNVLHV